MEILLAWIFIWNQYALFYTDIISLNERENLVTIGNGNGLLHVGIQPWAELNQCWLNSSNVYLSVEYTWNSLILYCRLISYAQICQ